MATLEYIDYSVRDATAEVQFDRPEILNPLNAQVYEELVTALERANGDEGVTAIILTGKGRAFSAGRDLEQSGPETKPELRQYLHTVITGQRLLREGDRPTIAAINGPALGGACAFALSCDFRVMAADAFLRDQHINIGMPPEGRLCELIGESAAKEYLLLGEDITAADADRLGLAIDVVEDDVMARARDLASTLDAKPRAAVRHGKAFTTERHDLDFEAYVDAFWECMTDPEHEEALAAVAEDREPDYDRD
ncbi:MAG: enoyl-CoA hydratase/isomerase family protein [Salinirussus sp.]